jgi:acetate kinase
MGCNSWASAWTPNATAFAPPVISSRSSRVTVRVIRTDEEVTIAKTVCRVLRFSTRA